MLDLVNEDSRSLARKDDFLMRRLNIYIYITHYNRFSDTRVPISRFVSHSIFRDKRVYEWIAMDDQSGTSSLSEMVDDIKQKQY